VAFAFRYFPSFRFLPFHRAEEPTSESETFHRAQQNNKALFFDNFQ
jgi:hypothetical protein